MTQAAKSQKILVVEDESDIRDLILLHLKRSGYETDWTDNGEDALARISAGSYDLVVLDWMLSGLSGLEICKRIGRRVPVLMVTARAEAADIVLGLEFGADDYVTKPFETPVFLARVRALLRRQGAAEAVHSKGIRIGELLLDLEKHQARCGSELIPLTISEFKLLSALMSNAGRVLSRDRLIELVQGEGVVVVDRAIDTHVFGLRKKLGPCANVIETVRGVGYRVPSAD